MPYTGKHRDILLRTVPDHDRFAPLLICPATYDSIMSQDQHSRLVVVHSLFDQSDLGSCDPVRNGRILHGRGDKHDPAQQTLVIYPPSS